MSRATHRLALLALVAGTSLAGGCDSAPSTCPTGQIQSIDFEIGAGPQANDSSRVRLTSTGTLEDGRLIFSDVDETVNLWETAPIGFRQGVAGMRANGRRRFTLPPNLGFGPDGVPGIPSCARLIFTVELHDVLPLGCSNNASTVTIENPVEGSGVEATATSRVTVNFTLTLQDGTLIDSGSSQQFLLDDPSVIIGIRQGIVGMREGGRRRVYIPPNLGYGAAGIPGQVPGCATLVLDVELIAVQPPACSNNAPNVTIEDPVVGSGAEAVGTSRVTVNSTLSLLNGTIIETRSNAQFLLTDASVLAGIRQGIVGMRVGGQRRVFIPPNLGYGLAGLPTQGVPGCATLVYDVELIAVEP